MQSGDYKRALEAFRDAADSEKDAALAMHGTGLVYFHTGQAPRCVETLEKATKLGLNRALVHNLAVVHLRDNPMRAAKYVRDYLAQPNVPLDEPLQNVLGAALDAAGTTDAKNGVAFTQFREFYFAYDKRLASGRTDGQARWGMRWIPATEAERKWRESLGRSKEFAKLDKEVGRAAQWTKKAYEKLDDLNRSFALHSDREKYTAVRRVRDAVASEQDVRRRHAEARALLGQTEMPEFPRYLQFIAIDALRPEQHPPQ